MGDKRVSWRANNVRPYNGGDNFLGKKMSNTFVLKEKDLFGMINT
jgi:hypothetical protein